MKPFILVLNESVSKAFKTFQQQVVKMNRFILTICGGNVQSI
jgi:hypothetical protein